jgi:hypothetical protein
VWVVVATVLGVMLASAVLLDMEPSFPTEEVFGSVLVLSVIGPALAVLIWSAVRRSWPDAMFALTIGTLAVLAFIQSFATQFANDMRDFG